MWKSFKQHNFTSLGCYSTFSSDLKEALLIVKQRKGNLSWNVRHRSTNSQKHVPDILSKRPPPSLINYKPAAQPKQGKQKSIPPSAWVLLSVPLATFGLGTWQVQRRKWKLNLIENLESKLNEPPIDLPEDLSELSTLEYRKVNVKGKFDHSQELFLGPRSLINKGDAALQSGIFSPGSKKVAGHNVITPFILSDTGERILINRGWVPTSTTMASKRKEGQIEDEVEFVGVVRVQEKRGTFVPESKPNLRVFHYRNIEKMAKRTNALPVLLDASEESTVTGGPIGGQTNVSIRNEHMSYIITWYSLCGITTLMWLKKFVF